MATNSLSTSTLLSPDYRYFTSDIHRQFRIASAIEFRRPSKLPVSKVNSFCGSPLRRYKMSVFLIRRLEEIRQSRTLFREIIESFPTYKDILRPMALKKVIKYKHDNKVRPEYVICDSAAAAIQNCWMRFVCKQVFLYLRKLVSLYSAVEPGPVLRPVNPREASLLDPASGTHIRFRLGGESFPPLIFYKIFTHRPVVDLGSSSPRIYASSMSHVHETLEGKETNPTPRYERTENNDWRLFTSCTWTRQLAGVFSSYHHAPSNVYHPTTSKFHHMKEERCKDNLRRRKSRRIDWLKKLYTQRAEPIEEKEDEMIEVLVRNAVSGMAKEASEKGPDSILDAEVEELLEWTESIDFEDYSEQWQMTGTSLSSEEFIIDPLDDHITPSSKVKSLALCTKSHLDFSVFDLLDDELEDEYLK